MLRVLPRAGHGHVALLCVQPSCCIISIDFLVAGLVGIDSAYMAVVCLPRACRGSLM